VFLYINFGRFKLFKFDLNFVIDIGAHTGSFSNNLKKLFPDCEFVLFEPNKYCHQFIKDKKFRVFDWLLYKEKDVQLNFYFDKLDNTSTGRSIYIENTNHFESENFEIINSKILDDFKSPNIIDLIKLDVQGAEIDIILGGLKTLNKTKYLLLETSLIQYNQDAPLEKEVISFLKRFGFKNYIVFDKHIWNSDNINKINLNKGQVFQRDLLFMNNKNNFFEKIRFNLLKFYIRIKG